MKIISGELGGRRFHQPTSRSVRPLSEKVRAALFDVVGPVAGLTILDAYAGSGAAGFEAASRGAVLVDAIEANARVAKVIESNAKLFELDWGYVLHRYTVETWLASPQQQPPTPRYGLIIADPPYVQLEPDILQRLTAYLIPEGILVLSHSSKLTAPDLAGVELVQHKAYGDTALSFYRRGAI